MSLTPEGPRYDSKPDQPRDPGVLIEAPDKEALESRHYDLDDIGDEFSSAHIKEMDKHARAGDHAEVGRMWATITAAYRAHRLDTAKYFLEVDENKNEEAT